MLGDADIEKLATLARIRLRDGEAASLRADFERILGYVSEVEKETAGVVRKEAGVLRNVMREDGPETPAGTHTETLLSAAPRRSGDYIAVKNVFEK